MDKVKTYTVKKGDSLHQIAVSLNVPWKKLKELNKLDDTLVLKVGQKLKTE